MTLYNIPRLYCPFDSLEHPKSNEIERHTNDWLLEYNLVTSLELLEKYEKQRLPIFIARSFPFADFADISIWSDLNSLLFILDDEIDGQEIIKDEPSFIAFRDQFIAVLTSQGQYSEEDGPILHALSNFWVRICQRSSIKWQRKFIQGIRDMFAGGLWQFNHLMAGTCPGYNDYLKYRQYFGAAHLSTDILEVTGKIDLPEEVYLHDSVFHLTEIARNTICFSNDLFSLAKEQEELKNQGTFNIVTVLMNDRSIDINEAIRQAVEIHDNLVREFIDLSEDIFTFGADTNRMLERYVTALKYLMSGNIYWSTKQTSRYPHIYG